MLLVPCDIVKVGLVINRADMGATPGIRSEH
jgi:hypothetical protein